MRKFDVRLLVCAEWPGSVKVGRHEIVRMGNADYISQIRKSGTKSG